MKLSDQLRAWIEEEEHTINEPGDGLERHVEKNKTTPNSSPLEGTGLYTDTVDPDWFSFWDTRDQHNYDHTF
jgi:hypothetical protein